MIRWTDLAPDTGISAALDQAGLRPVDGTQDQKKNWSERFANGCAIAVANAFRETELKRKTIKPLSLDDGTEPLIPLGSGSSKRIDVTVVDAILGLEVGVSLKGLNFRDPRSENFDKNITGRLYELSDEVRLVHDHLPHAFMAGIVFLPLDSTCDKISANSSFANSVVKLRERTGRLDPALTSHSSRCDAGYVALYTTGEETDEFTPGIARFFNVDSPPPRRGRPKVDDTLTLDEAVAEIVSKATLTQNMRWGEAES